MGFKSKVFGFVAASALTLSMGAGIASADNGKANLIPGQCSAGQVLAHQFEDFGNWKYNGTSKYELQGTTGVDNVATFRARVASVPAPNVGCDVVIDTAGLSNGDDTIGPNYFMQMRNNGTVLAPMPAKNTNQSLGVHEYDVQLVSVPSAVSTGEYTGTITITVQNAD